MLLEKYKNILAFSKHFRRIIQSSYLTSFPIDDKGPSILHIEYQEHHSNGIFWFQFQNGHLFLPERKCSNDGLGNDFKGILLNETILSLMQVLLNVVLRHTIGITMKGTTRLINVYVQMGTGQLL